MKSKLQEIYETSTRNMEIDRLEAARQGDWASLTKAITQDYMDNYELSNFFELEDNQND